MRPMLLPGLIAAILLIGCATAPLQPYWKDQQWINALGQAIHNGLHYPVTKIQGSFPSGSAVITFDYDNGKLESPSIVKSTGSRILDDAILKQLPGIKLPPARGPGAQQPHAFQMEAGLHPDDIGLLRSIHRDLAAHTRYPHAALMQGATGWLLASFNYRNGTVSDPVIAKSSGSRELDHSALKELRTIAFSKPPDWLRDKTLNLTVSFCYSFGRRGCPTAVMQVRYVSLDNSVTTSKLPCAELGYKYLYGRVSDVHLVESSGNSGFDKHVLAEVTAGRFKHLSSQGNAVGTYDIPVCSNGSSDTGSAPPDQD